MNCEPAQSTRLCCKVIQTLAALLCGNEASRNRVRDDIGYDTLYSLLSGLVGKEGPSEELLMQLLSLVLEARGFPFSFLPTALQESLPVRHFHVCSLYYCPARPGSQCSDARGRNCNWHIKVATMAGRISLTMLFAGCLARSSVVALL